MPVPQMQRSVQGPIPAPSLLSVGIPSVAQEINLTRNTTKNNIDHFNAKFHQLRQYQPAVTQTFQ